MLKKVFSIVGLMGMVACSQPTESSAALPLGRADIQPTPARRAEPCAETDSFAVQVFSSLSNLSLFRYANLAKVLKVFFPALTLKVKKLTKAV